MDINSLTIVIFGGSGDLTKRKLIPALYQLFRNNRVPQHFSILGVGRTKFDDVDYRIHLKESLLFNINIDEHNDKAIDNFLESVHYFTMDQSQVTEYSLLKKRLEQIDNTDGNFFVLSGYSTFTI